MPINIRLTKRKLSVIMPIAKIGRRGQMTIPKVVREHFGLEEGDSLFFYVQDGSVVVRPVTKTVLDMAGTLSEADEAVNWESVKEEARKGIAAANDPDNL